MANPLIGKPGLVSITKKILMSVTGLLLCVFLVLHLLGNTLLLFGNVAFNNYAHLLMTFPPIVWAMEIGLAPVFLTRASTWPNADKSHAAPSGLMLTPG